ncbi:MAG: FGGY-family carbohydrate kinase [Roseiarcus sp.]|jgi:L-ribulokinase
MPETFVIGLDFGSESARGVLIEAGTGRQAAYHAHPYRHGIITGALPGGRQLPAGFALQDAADYLEAAEITLRAIGAGRDVSGIGVDFTASSPLPAMSDGRAMSEIAPDEPHAYVKLWKHGAAQAYAEKINRAGGSFLENFGGKVSGEWMLPKAAQIAAEAPELWRRSEKFIEAGDWLVGRLAEREARSLDLAAYKAQYVAGVGYPDGVVADIASKLSAPQPVGSPVGPLSGDWRRRTGIRGEAVVAVAVIDSHVVLPAVGAYGPGVLVGALGTSAAYLALDDAERPMPPGIEGRAYGAALPGLWCYEAGQAAFGDALAWFVRTFPRSDDLAENFARYNREAAALAPGQNRLLAIDWWNGNRVPYADTALRGLIAGFDLSTTAVDIYRALIDGICFGARSIVDLFRTGGIPVERIVLTSGLAKSNPFLLQTMADVLGQPVHVPEIENATCVGAAIHGAVAAGVVSDFRVGAERLGARSFDAYLPDPARDKAYRQIYARYRELSSNAVVRKSLRALS